MKSLRLLAAALALLGSWAAAPSAQAQSEDLFSLRAALGGAVPFAQKESYVVADLTQAAQGNGQLSLASSLPLSRMVAPVFDARPQLVLNGRLDLGSLGAAAVSLNAYVSAGVAGAAANAERPLLGVAALRLVF
ncbi:hypothetical protein E0493_04435 [Roseomonas sp. M0104]|uniref:Transporter n=1 Tax=Teichococcus coralli TaxID=2545983 RepID=A0A845B8N5_9PROT|nr:hypothetical protein [Pseudoroseomonas coralli]MXP62600.1 hypothetical protein [Pseudoroseomonas coralli]